MTKTTPTPSREEVQAALEIWAETEKIMPNDDVERPIVEAARLWLESQSEPCDDCDGTGIDYCDSCVDEGLDGVGHGKCPVCDGSEWK